MKRMVIKLKKEQKETEIKKTKKMFLMKEYNQYYKKII